MRIDKNSKLAGFPILKIRDLLRKCHECVDQEGVMHILKIDKNGAKKIITALEQKGFIELGAEETERASDSTWEITKNGRRFAAASALKPIPREKAETLVSDLLKRVEEVHENDEFMYDVELLEAFGSFITDSPDLGDIDLALTLRRKEKFQGNWGELSSRQAAESGKCFSDFVEKLYYSETKVRRYLKKRSPYLHFLSPNEPKDLGAKTKVLYEHETEQGTLTLPNGDKYAGEYKDGLPHGQGTYTKANGDKYVGEFKDGKWHGQGTYTFPDGSKYVGEWKDGKEHGQGNSEETPSGR